MVKVSSRYDHGDRPRPNVTVNATESGDDTDWDESPIPTTIVDHGAGGSAEDVDPADGYVHVILLDDDLTVTLIAPDGEEDVTLQFWVTQDGTGGWELSFDADGGTVTGDISGHTTTAGETFRVIAQRIPGTTNDWVVDLVGGSGASALTVSDEGTPLTTGATSIDFVGAGVTASAVGDAVTVTIPGGGSSDLIPVDTGEVTYDHSGDDVLVTVETVWGIDTDSPYYDDAGAVAGEEAALYWDPVSLTYVVVPYNIGL